MVFHIHPNTGSVPVVDAGGAGLLGSIGTATAVGVGVDVGNGMGSGASRRTSHTAQQHHS